jgi:hypothetical protein
MIRLPASALPSSGADPGGRPADRRCRVLFVLQVQRLAQWVMDPWFRGSSPRPAAIKIEFFDAAPLGHIQARSIGWRAGGYRALLRNPVRMSPSIMFEAHVGVDLDDEQGLVGV